MSNVLLATQVGLHAFRNSIQQLSVFHQIVINMLINVFFVSNSVLPAYVAISSARQQRMGVALVEQGSFPDLDYLLCYDFVK